jgi:hypothetical protein
VGSKIVCKKIFYHRKSNRVSHLIDLNPRYTHDDQNIRET